MSDGEREREDTNTHPNLKAIETQILCQTNCRIGGGDRLALFVLGFTLELVVSLRV